MAQATSEQGGALYRKYRPQGWKDVIGQDHIVKALESAAKLGNVAHAYLFCGSRGTGKTSIARIFAREIGTSENDLYEMDAASNRGIDEIRDIRAAVAVLPFESPYKVYIMDEVHMLTKDAWNAFLKTLEEPPKHVVFVMATTEMDKVPDTVVSRCQVFTFKRPTQAVLKETVSKVAKKEGYALEPASAELVAFLGDGSFRDSLGILQKVIGASADKKISREEVETITGAPRAAIVNNMLAALDARDPALGLRAIRTASAQNIDMKTLVTLLLGKVRAVLLLRYAADLKKSLEEEFSLEDFELLSTLAGKQGSGITSKTVIELLNAQDLMRSSPIPELPLELVFAQDRQ